MDTREYTRDLLDGGNNVFTDQSDLFIEKRFCLYSSMLILIRKDEMLSF